MNSDIKEEIELMNSIISNSIRWGGDPGGPYCCCEEYYDRLLDLLNNWIALRGLSDICMVLPGYDLKIVFKY